MSENKNNVGLMPGIFACVFAVLGILFLGFVFVPIAIIITLIGLYISIKAKSISGIAVNVLATILCMIGIITSPALLAMIGFGAAI